MTADRSGILLGLIAVLLWSTIAPALKLALNAWPLHAVLWVAVTVSLLFFMAVLLLRGRLWRSLRLLKRYWRRALFGALLAPLGYYLLLLGAYDQLSAQIVQPINYTWAFVLTLLVAVRLKRPVRVQDWQGMALGYAGVVVLVVGAREVLMLTGAGLVMALLSTLIWALFWVMMMSDRRPALVAFVHHFILAWPVLTLSLWIWGVEFLRVPQGWWPALHVGLFEMGITFLLWITALNRVTHTARVANLIFLAPMLSLVWIVWLLGEPVVWTTPLALALIVLGQWWQHRARAPKTDQ